MVDWRAVPSARVLWLAGVVLAAAVFPLLLYSGRLYYAEGGQSPDAPGMLFVAVLYTSPVWVGGWLLFIAAYLVGYRGGGRITALRGGSVLAMFLAGVATAVSLLFVWQVARIEFWRASRLPFTLWLLAVAAYCQYLRAAAVTRSLRG